MKRPAALGLVAAVFLAGLAAGVLGARWFAHRPFAGRGPIGPPPFRAYFTQDDLDLSRAQQLQLEALFDRQRERFDELHRELQPRVEGLMEQTQAEVEQILTPEQLERYRSRRRRWHRGFGPRDRRWPGRNHHPDGANPPPPPPIEDG